MSTLSPRQTPPAKNAIPILSNGDRLKQPEFHRRYRACPEDIKCELIGGTVYMASPLRWPHGNYSQQLSLIFGLYRAATPGVEAADNATIILGEESEPQPDLALRLLPEYGGRSRLDEDEYLQGPPELLAEIAYSSRAIDLHQKREDYERTGIQEYLVLAIEDQQLHWFHFPTGKMIQPNRQGISRSQVFPGLWIEAQSLLVRNTVRQIEIARQGLASREHAAFLKRLAAVRRKHS